jgi:hypothetical protein
VNHRAHTRFWKCYRALPADIRELADRNYALLRQNPSHPSLHFKKVGTFWSSRVGIHFRAVAIEAGADLVWFWIGSHAEYDRLVGRKPANPALQPTSRAQEDGKKTRKTRATRG